MLSAENVVFAHRKEGIDKAMAMKWIEKKTIRKGSKTAERLPWITRETIVVGAALPVPVYHDSPLPEIKLVEIPGSAQRELSSDTVITPEVERSPSLREILHNMAVSSHWDSYNEEPLDAIPVTRQRTIPHSTARPEDLPTPPAGVASNRIISVERDQFIENASPAIGLHGRAVPLIPETVEEQPPLTNLGSAVISHGLAEQIHRSDSFTEKDDPFKPEEFVEAAESVTRETMVDDFEESLNRRESDRRKEKLCTEEADDERAIDAGSEEVDPEAVPVKVFDEIPINEEYIIPTNLLQKTVPHDRESWESEIRRHSELLVKTLNDFGIESRVSMVNRGPVVTLYEMQLAPGIKVTRIVSLADDIALALAASRVRVVAPIPGKAAIGIEVPNIKREMVTLGDILNTKEFLSADMILRIAMGKDILGKPVMIDLKKQPHLLIAGATGAGKSVCVNAVILSLICSYDPNHLRFIMIDPKMVELQLYNGMPHLLTPVITEPDEAPKALKWAIVEMERRYRLLSEQCTRDIERYNQKIASMRHPEEFETLPYIVIIIDEFADLMMVAPKEVENYITRIAQKARAVGIHLVLATQRPSVDVITGIIKANFPARVAFQVAQKIDSRTIIDQNGAEKLLGKGDMLYQSPTSSFPVRIQGAYISEEEVMLVVKRACSFGRPRYIDFDEFLKTESAAEDDDNDIQDEMFVEALKIVEETKKASASYLQRRLSIGYNRAARIVEKMEELGYVGPPQGSKPREVYV
jgi:DNA segregation ATPase FtsK/SpoIIIE-like protein